MKRTPSEMKTTVKPLTDKEIEVQRWIEELKKDCPEVHPYFIEHIAKAYQINPDKFDNIIENNITLSSKERMKAGEYESVRVYNSPKELEQPKSECPEKKSV